MYSGVFALLWGLGAFLYGINIMSEKTERAFGNRLKIILGKTARGKYSSVITGTAVTAFLQSSSAVTVLLVSLVESGAVSLFQSVGIIMGSNIGTTVTSLLIAFDFSAFAPFFIASGAFVKLFAKKETFSCMGDVFFGFGLLFLGMEAMSGAFSSVKDNPVFLNMIISASGKIGGILSGILMTVIIQSSSAAVGILQGLAAEGLVSLDNAVYIVLGQNIGTVITVLLASVGRSVKAKQIGRLHLLFNIIGCLFFIPLCALLPVGEWLSRLGNPSMAVSVFHIVFNVVNTVILFPFYDRFVREKEERF
ncbi:MAG: Na/Pi cotransporter family protein [Clostridia bacterium]|nr:Na/Pi cotransporter family protein [Clostridia bacterium]